MVSSRATTPVRRRPDPVAQSRATTGISPVQATASWTSYSASRRQPAKSHAPCLATYANTINRRNDRHRNGAGEHPPPAALPTCVLSRDHGWIFSRFRGFELGGCPHNAAGEVLAGMESATAERMPALAVVLFLHFSVLPLSFSAWPLSTPGAFFEAPRPS